jgi:S-adenosylmethionine decarboxylase
VSFAGMAGGTEWLVDAFGCDAARLRDAHGLSALGQLIITRLELTVLGTPLVHEFGGAGGVTALYLLSESHLAWHTYPESELATFNVYCCRSRPPLDWAGLLRTELGAREVTVQTVLRGARAGKGA